MAIRQHQQANVQFVFAIMQFYWKGSIASTLVWWLFRVCSKWSSCNWVGCDYAAYKDLLIMRRKKNFWLCRDHCTQHRKLEASNDNKKCRSSEASSDFELNCWIDSGRHSLKSNSQLDLKMRIKLPDKQQASVVYCRVEARFNLHTTSRWWAPI